MSVRISCRTDLLCVGTPASYFTSEVDKIWWTLSADLGIEVYAFCQIEGSRRNLAGLYHDEGSDHSDDESDEDEWSDEGTEEEDVSDDDDDDMPDLIDPLD